jgi:hypothetical protein
MIWLGVWILCSVSFVLGCYWGSRGVDRDASRARRTLLAEHKAGDRRPESESLLSERHVSGGILPYSES